jgi:chromosome segregation ATPase
MAPERAEPMRAARRLDTEHKRALVLAALDAVLESGRHPSVAEVARRARVGRKFVYDHPELRAEVELRAVQSASRQAGEMAVASRVSAASLRAELENARAQNERLTRQLRALERRLSQAEGAHLVADELLPEGALAELADRQLAERAAELDRQLFEAKEQLRETTEELEAARAINRELMQQANRARQAPGPSGPPTTKEERP